MRGMAQAPFVIRPSSVVLYFVPFVWFIFALILFIRLTDTFWDTCNEQGIYSYDACLEVQEGISQYAREIGFINCLIPIAIFLLASILQKNHCYQCGSAHTKSEIKKTLNRKITAFSEGTHAVTSLNPVLGIGSGGQGASIGIGAMQSTSHTPVKLASYECSVKCPECELTYYWTSNVKVRIWTSVEGVETVEDLESVSYPFKMV